MTFIYTVITYRVLKYSDNIVWSIVWSGLWFIQMNEKTCKKIRVQCLKITSRLGFQKLSDKMIVYRPENLNLTGDMLKTNKALLCCIRYEITQIQLVMLFKRYGGKGTQGVLIELSSHTKCSTQGLSPFYLRTV